MGQDPNEIRHEIEETRERMGEKVDAIGYKADVPGRARGYVSDKKEAVVSKVRGTTPDTEQLRHGAKRVGGLTRENPLGLAIGAAAGYGLAAAVVWLRDRNLLSHDLDGWLAIAAVLVIYGLTEVAGGYGFLAAFAGGVAFRRYERDHEYNRRVHEGAEMVEKFSELGLILLLGSVVTISALDEPGIGGWLLVPVLLLVVRPAAVTAALVGSGMAGRERSFLAWFGVRGIGSLYYAAVAVGAGVLSSDEASTVFWTTAACVITSVLIHGMTADPLGRRWLAGAAR